MHDSNLHLYESSSDKSGYNERVFNPIIKVDEIITDESDRSNLHLPKDNSQLFADESPLASAVTNDEPPIKEQRLPNILSNVQKLVPSAEILKAERERTENQSLEEKTK